MKQLVYRLLLTLFGTPVIVIAFCIVIPLIIIVAPFIFMFGDINTDKWIMSWKLGIIKLKEEE